jgi:HAD superfamily hydrolase (TIGR01457 family)
MNAMPPLLERYSAFIIDLDGVLYLLDTPIDGSPETVNRLAAAGKEFVFLTNNSSATPRQYVEKLGRFGMDISTGQVVTSSQAIGRHLELNHQASGKSAFAIGEDGLLEELEARGLRLVEGEEARAAEFVFVGWDRKFDFEKLKTAVIALRNGAVYIAANTDATYPTPQGLWPGAGTIVAAVTTGSGREPFVAGKPNPLMVDLALSRAGVRAGSALLVGDRLDSDILAGSAAGVDTLLVLTGVSSKSDIERTGIVPTHIRESLAGLLED